MLHCSHIRWKVHISNRHTFTFRGLQITPLNQESLKTACLGLSTVRDVWRGRIDSCSFQFLITRSNKYLRSLSAAKLETGEPGLNKRVACSHREFAPSVQGQSTPLPYELTLQLRLLSCESKFTAPNPIQGRQSPLFLLKYN